MDSKREPPNHFSDFDKSVLRQKTSCCTMNNMAATNRLLIAMLLLASTSRALAATKETVTIDLAVKGEPITHKAAGFARGLTLTDPPQDMLASLHPIFFRQPALDSPAKYSAMAIYPRAKNL